MKNSIPGSSLISPELMNSAFSLNESSPFPLFFNLTINVFGTSTSTIIGSLNGSTISTSARLTCKILMLKFKLIPDSISNLIVWSNGGD